MPGAGLELLAPVAKAHAWRRQYDATQVRLVHRLIASLRSARIALLSPPASSSLAGAERLPHFVPEAE
jgi:hypothetical protein